jgi:hypothetical protein
MSVITPLNFALRKVCAVKLQTPFHFIDPL